MKIRRYRGLGLKYYLAVAVFGVASTFYTFKPVRDRLEQRAAIAERQSALSAIEDAKKVS